jgi:putative heme-binding domain-containing protein
MGRIYRVKRVGSEHRPIPRLDKLDTAGLFAALDSPNGWQRDMAQMMLVWKNDKEAVPVLETLVRTAKDPRTRLQALATLDGMQSLDSETLRKALYDENLGVADHALRLCEGRLTADGGLHIGFLRTLNRPQIPLAVANVLGSWDDKVAGGMIGSILVQKGSDRTLTTAALSSLTAKNFATVAETVLHDTATHPPTAQAMEGLIAFAVAGSDNATLVKLLASVAVSKDGTFNSGQLETLVTLLDALSRRKTSLAALAKSGPEMAAAVAKLDAAFVQAKKVASDPKSVLQDRLTAIRLLGRGPGDTSAGRMQLAELLGPQSAADVQAAAVAALARSDSSETPGLLLKSWKGYSPPVRAAVLDSLVSREAWLPNVFDALEKKQILAVEVDAAARQRLLAHSSPAIRDRAAKLLAGGIDADRQKVIDRYRPALTKAGDKDRGKAVFTKSCSACHKVGDIGKGLGPDLAALSDKSADYLLVNLLDPNRAVEARYLAYTARTKDERARVGFLASESATSITLVAADGQQHTILRTDIEELESSTKSVMPEGLEKDVSVDQMADLIAFLRSSVPQPRRKEFAGNKPEIVKPGGDGAIVLSAATAEVYGSTLEFEPRYKNLGFWGSADDRAVWTINVPKAGTYEVVLDWACPRGEAGKAMIMEVGTESLTSRIEATANWEDYKQAKIGELKLVAGEQRLTVRAAGAFKGYLMDLRSVRLVPLNVK